MFKCKEISRMLLPAFLLVSFGFISQVLGAQSAGQSLTPAQSPTQTQASPAPSQSTHPFTREEQGDSLLARQQYQAAIETYGKAPKMTAVIWNKMGIAYQMLFNAKDATRCYKESLKLSPGNSQVMNNLATIYASLKEYGQADKTYRKASKLDPHSAVIFKNLGTNLLAEHKYNKGWEAYKQAIAIDPQIFADHAGPAVENPSNVQERGAMNYYMAVGCASAGHTDCALDYLRRALDEGFVTRKKIATDNEFASLRSNPDFQQLIAEQQRQ